MSNRAIAFITAVSVIALVPIGIFLMVLLASLPKPMGVVIIIVAGGVLLGSLVYRDVLNDLNSRNGK